MANDTAYKPNIRVGVDWDGDGFIHLNGVADGATPNLITNALYTNKWVKGYLADGEEVSTFTPLTDDNTGVIQSSVQLGDAIASEEAVSVIALRTDPKQQAPTSPQVLFDGSGFDNFEFFDNSNATFFQEETEYGLQQVHKTSTATANFEVMIGRDREDIATGVYSFSLELGKTYTFKFWLRWERVAGTGTGLAPHNTDCSLWGYYKSLGSDFVNANALPSLDPRDFPFPESVWIPVAYQWVASESSEFSFNIIPEIQFFDSTLHDTWLTGFMLHESSTTLEQGDIPIIGEYHSSVDKWVSNQFYSNKIADNTQFDNELTANIDYTLGFYIFSDISKTIDYTLRSYEYTTRSTSDATGTISVTSTPLLVELAIDKYASNNYSTVLELYHATEDDVNLTVYGFAIYPSTEGYHVLIGTTAEYDNLKDYGVDVNWQLGKKKFYDPMAYEGTLDLTLDNTSKIFSPANTDSPLFGRMKQNLKVLVQMQHPSTLVWHTMWAGWTDEFHTKAGLFSTRRATIKCNQGLFRLREGEFSYKPTDNQRIDTVIKELMNYSGWRTTTTPLQWWLSESRQLGVDTYLVAESNIWSTVDEGAQTYDMIGHGWSNKTKVDKALKDLLQAEDAVLWVTRDGHLELLSRERFAYFGETIAALDVGVLPSADYVYGDNLINKVEVFLETKEEVQSATIWRTKVPIISPNYGTSEPILLTYEKDEGTERTVDNLQLNQSDMVVTVYEIPRKRRKQQIMPAVVITKQKILDKIKIKTQTDGQSRTFLTIENDNRKTYHVDVEITGDYIVGGEGISYEFIDYPAIASYDALHKIDIKNPIISTYAHARSLAHLRLERNANPVGEFKSITVITSDAFWTGVVTAFTLGSMVSLSEDQTGETDRVHVIIGERAKVIKGVLHMTYDLARVIDDTYMKFGDNLTSSSTFFI